jgi:transketolase
MRNAIISEIYKQMKENKDIYFLTGDLGYCVLEPIENDFPDRFINVGIAEQNMIGMASGLALSGKKVYVYSIIPFLTMRCFEQIRNDICYHDADVTLLGVGSGLSYGILSSTHFALEDVAILRSLPNMTIFSPADEIEAISGLNFFNNYHHPLYIRIGKKEEPVVFSNDYSFSFGKGTIISKGNDGIVFTTGSITTEVINALKKIKTEFKFNLTLVDISTIKPIDKKFVIDYCIDKKKIFTVEEHSIIGGLGSTIAEIISENVIDAQLIRIGTKDVFIRNVGNQSYLRQVLGLDSEGIAKCIISYL